MSEADAPDDAAAASGKKQFSSKIVSGIGRSGGKIASSGGSVMSGIASSGGRIVSGGGRAFHKISLPIGSAVRKTIDKANDSLHGNSSHSTSSAKDLAATDASSKEDSSAAPEDETLLEEKGAVPLSAVNDANSDANDTEHPSSKTDRSASGTVASSSKDDLAPVPKDEAIPEPTQGTTDVITGSIENPSEDAKGSHHGGLLGATNKLLVSPIRGAAHKVAEGGNKLIVNPVKGASKKVAEGGNKILVTPVKDASKIVAEGGKALFRTNSKGTAKEIEQEEDLPDVPPDATLQKMNVIINKRLKDVSIPDYYAIAWSEGNGTNTAPLYGPWLKESGKENIDVGKWEFADKETVFLGEWDGEKYTQRRVRCSHVECWSRYCGATLIDPSPTVQVVRFVFNKQIPFQISPTLAKVKHTQYCRVEGKDKCVVAMTIDMQGVPYSDCFHVEIRWVATRLGKNDISIQVGLFVNFIKSTM